MVTSARLVCLAEHLATAKRAYQQFELAKDVIDNEFHPEWHGLKTTPAFGARLYLYEYGLAKPHSPARKFLVRALYYPDSEDASLAFAIYVRYKSGDTKALSQRLSSLLDPSCSRSFEALHALRMIFDTRPPVFVVATTNQNAVAECDDGNLIKNYLRSIAVASWQPRQVVFNKRLTPEIIDTLLYGVTSTLLPIRSAMPAVKPFQAHRAVAALYALPTQAYALMKPYFAAFFRKQPEHRMLLLKELAARADVWLDPTATETAKVQEMNKVIDFANKLRPMNAEQAARITTVLPPPVMSPAWP